MCNIDKKKHFSPPIELQSAGKGFSQLVTRQEVIVLKTGCANKVLIQKGNWFYQKDENPISEAI